MSEPTVLDSLIGEVGHTEKLVRSAVSQKKLSPKTGEILITKMIEALVSASLSVSLQARKEADQPKAETPQQIAGPTS